MYREPSYSSPYSRLFTLKRGEMLPRQYQLSKFYYAFDKEQWVPCKRPWGPEFYQMTNYLDRINLLDYLKDFLTDEPEAVVFCYPTGNGFYTAVPLGGCYAKVKNELQYR